jgi:hypothetical protein
LQSLEPGGAGGLPISQPTAELSTLMPFPKKFIGYAKQPVHRDASNVEERNARFAPTRPRQSRCGARDMRTARAGKAQKGRLFRTNL